MSNPKYRNLSIPDEMVNEIEVFIKNNPDLGFTSIAEFVKHCIRIYMEFRTHLLETEDKNKGSD